MTEPTKTPSSCRRKKPLSIADSGRLAPAPRIITATTATTVWDLPLRTFGVKLKYHGFIANLQQTSDIRQDRTLDNSATRNRTPPQRYSLVTNKVYCNYCPGYCCYSLKGSTLFLDSDDINRIARHHKITDGEARKRFIAKRNTFKTRPDGSCIFLSNERMRARCSIHPARPRQCREFPYHSPCPYLEREDLLQRIQPKLEKALLPEDGSP